MTPYGWSLPCWNNLSAIFYWDSLRTEKCRSLNETFEDLNDTPTKAKENKEKIRNLLLQNDKRSHEVTSYKERVIDAIIFGRMLLQATEMNGVFKIVEPVNELANIMFAENSLKTQQKELLEGIQKWNEIEKGYSSLMKRVEPVYNERCNMVQTILNNPSLFENPALQCTLVQMRTDIISLPIMLIRNILTFAIVRCSWTGLPFPIDITINSFVKMFGFFKAYRHNGLSH